MLIADIWSLAAIGALLAGVVVWRRAWSRHWGRGGDPVAASLPAWVGAVPGGGLLLLGAVLLHTGAAWDLALTCALFLVGGLGLAVVAAGGRYRPSPGRRASQSRRAPRAGAVTPPPGWRASLSPMARLAVARLVLAGPVAGAAALAGAALLAAHGPGDAADRLISAGLAAPLLWAGLGTWGLCAHRPGRAAAGLSLLLAVLVAPLAWGMR